MQRRHLSDSAHSSRLQRRICSMAASSAMHLMLCVLTVGASLQAAAAAGRGGRALLQGDVAVPDAAPPTFITQVRCPLPAGPGTCALSGGYALMGVPKLRLHDKCTYGKLRRSRRDARLPSSPQQRLSSACG